MRRLALGVLAALLAAPAAASGLDDLDIIKRTAQRLDAADVSPAEERRIGEGMADRLLGATPPVDDPAVQRYVNRVGLWVAAGSRRPDLDWTFAVVDTPAVNAFAAPGGFVFITRGLFLLLDDEAELAVVLGHEIGHVTARHHLQALADNVRSGLLQDLVSAQDIEGADPAALDRLARAGASLYGTGLKREDEYAADRIGVVIAARAGYDPWAMLSVLTVLKAMDPAAPLLQLHSATHPPAQVRRARLDRLLETDLQLEDAGAHPAARFRAMRARLAAGGDG